MIIFDIGACEGLDSIKYAKMYPQSEVYAFEPVQKNLLQIQENIKKNTIKNIRVISKAVSNFNGTTTINLSSGTPKGAKNDNSTWDYGNKSSSILKPSKDLKKHYSWLKFKEKEKVEVISLMQFLSDENLTHIDFIHMDVQGSELHVLEGLEEKIASVRCGMA